MVNATQQSSSLTILDVGHGNCAVITNGASTILVDAGPGVAVLEYLRREGITRIDSVVLSHADADHIGGLIALLGASEFEVAKVIANSDALKRSIGWSNLAWQIDILARKGTLACQFQLREGDVLENGIHNVELSVLAPRDGLVMTGAGSKDPKGRPITSNSMSAVILIQAENRRIALLTGDIDELGLEYLLDTHQDITAEILVFPHHGGLAGGNSESTARFARRLTEMVKPSQVIFSLDRHRYGTPRPEIIDAVRLAAPDVRIACTQLSTACAPDVPVGGDHHLLPLFAIGIARNSCCAGTMRLALDPVTELQPSEDLHQRFVTEFAPTALCRRVLPVGSATPT